MPALQRQAERGSRRRPWPWALGGALIGGALVLATVALVGPGASGGFTVDVAVEAPMPPAPPPPRPPRPPPPVAAAPFADLGPCPAPFADVPAGALSQPTAAGDDVAGVATSPGDSRLVAAWTEAHVFVSRDGGAAWERVLEGDGAVLDASFDCHGRVLVVREGGLGVRDGSRERWRSVAGFSLALGEAGDPIRTGELSGPALVGGGRAIAVMGETGHNAYGPGYATAYVAVISDDLGTTWRHVDLGGRYDSQLRAEWTADTLRVAVSWNEPLPESQGIELMTVTPDGILTAKIDGYAENFALDGTRLYAPASACAGAGDPDALCVWSAGTWTVVPGPAPSVPTNWRFVIDGPVVVMWVGDQVYAVGPGGFSAPRPWTGWSLRTTDRAGRLWGIGQDHALVRI